MVQPIMQRKVMSLTEANTLIPKVDGLLKLGRMLNEKTNYLRSHLKELVNIWGQEIFDAGNPDYQYYSARVAEREALARQYQAVLSELQETGAVIKDVTKGLVDFYSRHNGQLIFLCWKQGESKIRHWHNVNAGFPARRPVDELKQVTLKDQV